jgi:hypothetical protein
MVAALLENRALGKRDLKKIQELITEYEKESVE